MGDTTVTCTSTAGPACSFKVTVTDDEAPVITTSSQTIKLWIPNHAYTTINLTDLIASVSDNCDDSVGVAVRITGVSSDEPDNGSGDGNTTNDIVIAADCISGVYFCSERIDNGNGRVYTITFTVTDALGNVTTTTATVYRGSFTTVQPQWMMDRITQFRLAVL